VIISLDHIAIAVPELDEAIKRYGKDFGIPFEGTDDVIEQRTTTAFFPISGTRIELIHPINGEGPVAKYLEKRGGGLHHLCFRTDDIEADMQRLTAKGYRFLTETPQAGAHGTRVAFIHPKSTGGVLIELAEHPEESP
tara:strand:+ start:325 stop:738 length:414 start_codon:yes stop_codon:yes gene_type:complete